MYLLHILFPTNHSPWWKICTCFACPSLCRFLVRDFGVAHHGDHCSWFRNPATNSFHRWKNTHRINVRFGTTPHPESRMPVTTRNSCIFSRVSRTKSSFAAVTGWEVNPMYGIFTYWFTHKKINQPLPPMGLIQPSWDRKNQGLLGPPSIYLSPTTSQKSTGFRWRVVKLQICEAVEILIP